MMFTDPGHTNSFLFSELNILRIEAMSLFERCAKDGTPARLLSFIEEQIAQDPPPVQLLYEIADDLHRRLQSLRQLQFALRAYALHTLRDDFSLDLAPLLPLNGFDPGMSVDALMARLLPDGAPDEMAVRHTLETAIESSLSVTDDILMVEGLHKFLTDWAKALSVHKARGAWIEGAYVAPPSRLQ